MYGANRALVRPAGPGVSASRKILRLDLLPSNGTGENAPIEDICSTETQLKDTSLQLPGFQTIIEKLLSDKSSLKAALNEKSRKSQLLEEENNEKNAEISRLSEQISQLTKDNVVLLRSNEALNQQLKQQEDDIRNLSQESQHLKLQLAKSREQQLRSDDPVCNHQSQECKSYREESALTERHFRQMSAEMTGLRKMLAEMKRKYLASIKQGNDANDNRNLIQQDLKAKEEKLDLLRKRNKTLQSKIQEQRENMTRLEEKLLSNSEENKRQLNSLRVELVEAQRKLHCVRNDAKTLKMQNDVLKKSFREASGVTRAASLTQNDKLSELESQLHDLSEQLQYARKAEDDLHLLNDYVSHFSRVDESSTAGEDTLQMLSSSIAQDLLSGIVQQRAGFQQKEYTLQAKASELRQELADALQRLEIAEGDVKSKTYELRERALEEVKLRDNIKKHQKREAELNEQLRRAEKHSQALAHRMKILRSENRKKEEHRKAELQFNPSCTGSQASSMPPRLSTLTESPLVTPSTSELKTTNAVNSASRLDVDVPLNESNSSARSTSNDWSDSEDEQDLLDQLIRKEEKRGQRLKDALQNLR